jgi:hypothetical protein
MSLGVSRRLIMKIEKLKIQQKGFSEFLTYALHLMPDA